MDESNEGEEVDGNLEYDIIPDFDRNA